MGAMYMECSSKEMNGVHEIFDTAIDIAVRGQDEISDETMGDSKPGSTGQSALPAKRKKRSNCKIL